MSEENKALVRRINEEVWGAHNVDNIDEYFAADYVSHNQFPGLPQGREGVRAFASLMASAFKDSDIVLEDQIALGDKVVTRWTSTGTHTGDFLGIPASGRQVKVTGINIDRIEGGKVVESWSQYDLFGMMQQFGVVPPADGGGS